jgi:adenine deaminase
MNYIVNKACSLGLDPILAIKLATINTSKYFNMPAKGAIAPGYDADLQVLSSFDANVPLMVFKNGKLVAEKGKLMKLEEHPKDIHIRGSVNVRWLELKDFRVKAEGEKIKVIEIVPSQIITKHIKAKAPVKKGYLVSDPSKDLLKICVVERHRASGNIGIGMIKGMGLKRGAIATSIAHDSHNIVSTGVSDKDIMAACVEVVKMGGGIAVVESGKLLAKLELPIAGLMSELPVEKVNKKLQKIIKATRTLGAVPDNPFFVLSFLCLPVIPELKITDKGLIDVEKFKVVEFFE